MLPHMTWFTYNYCPSLHLKELKYRLLLHLWYQMFVEENCCWVQESLRTLNWMLLFSKHQIWQNLHRRIVKNVIQTWQWLEILKSDKWKSSEENNKFSVNILVEWESFNSIASENFLNFFFIYSSKYVIWYVMSETDGKIWNMMKCIAEFLLIDSQYLMK